jgi:hypothetical protein
MKRILIFLSSITVLLTAVLGGCSTDISESSSPESAFTSSEAAISAEESAESPKPEETGDPEESSKPDESSKPEETSGSETTEEPDEFPKDEESSLPPEKEDNSPSISLEKTEFSAGERIAVAYKNTDSKDWVGFYREGSDPGTVTSIVWQYSVGKGTLNFNVSSLPGPGVYWVFLCDNDGYEVLDMKTVTVLDNDKNDYGAASASIDASVKDGYSKISVTVTPSSAASLTYKFYWAKGKSRLGGYEPIYTVTHSGKSRFTVDFNDCLYMPNDADGIEISVAKGISTPLYISAPSELKAKKSKLLYKFSVLTDLHVTASKPQHVSHLKMAFKDIIAQGGVSAIFTVGDNTDNGSAAEYDLLLKTVSSAGDDLPDIYFTPGNHDLVYGNGYDAQLKLFKEKTGAPGAHYSVELKGARFIVLGSDSAVTAGTIGRAQLDWLKAELDKCDKSTPTFLFLHQPLIDTVSGSLYSKDKVIQDWFGVSDAEPEIRAMLKEYPNAFLFTGHTHWTLESVQPMLAGYGKDANFINCASVGYLWNDNDKATGGSEGLYVEVYEDYILLRGREFLKGNWCAAAQFLIPIKGE